VIARPSTKYGTHPDLVRTGVLVDLEDRVVVLSSGGSVVRFVVRSGFACTHEKAELLGNVSARSLALGTNEASSLPSGRFASITCLVLLASSKMRELHLEQHKKDVLHLWRQWLIFGRCGTTQRYGLVSVSMLREGE